MAEKERHLVRRAALTVAVAGGVTLLAAPVASGAAIGQRADEAIARLRADGNRVVVDRLGTGPLSDCTVTSLRTRTINEPPRANPRFGVPIIPRVTVVHVGVRC